MLSPRPQLGRRPLCAEGIFRSQKLQISLHLSKGYETEQEILIFSPGRNVEVRSNSPVIDTAVEHAVAIKRNIPLLMLFLSAL